MEKLYDLSLVHSLALVVGYEECQLVEVVRSISLKILSLLEEIAGWEQKQK